MSTPLNTSAADRIVVHTKRYVRELQRESRATARRNHTNEVSPQHVDIAASTLENTLRRPGSVWTGGHILGSVACEKVYDVFAAKAPLNTVDHLVVPLIALAVSFAIVLVATIRR
jgi:hypothetical protein